MGLRNRVREGSGPDGSVEVQWEGEQQRGSVKILLCVKVSTACSIQDGKCFYFTSRIGQTIVTYHLECDLRLFFLSTISSWCFCSAPSLDARISPSPSRAVGHSP